jgi:cob(I)alamin adenosyltransferase
MIHVYTGDGKGKTTAALGSALRGAGAGMKIFIAQFVKGKKCSEIKALRKFKNIEVAQFGKSGFIRRKPDKQDIACAKKGLLKACALARSGDYDMIVLDEINVAVKLGLLEPEVVEIFIREAPKGLELILTGRDAHPRILKLADLVSEIKEVKHYYRRGVRARKGIEF